MLQFTNELLADILFRSRELASLTSSLASSDYSAQALVYLNRAYYSLCLGGREFLPPGSATSMLDWWWLRKDRPGVLTLQPVLIAGTVSVANNDGMITLSSPPAQSMESRYFQVENHPDVFRIVAHIGGAPTAILDDVYTGATAPAARYRLMRLEYSLEPDFLRLTDLFRVFQGNGDGWRGHTGGIDLIDMTTLDRLWPLRIVQSGVPTACAMIGGNRVRFNKAGLDETTSLIRVEYDYLARPAPLVNSAQEEPVVPVEHRAMLSDMALYFMAIDRNDDRAQTYASDGRNGIATMLREQERRLSMSDSRYGQILTRQPPAFRRQGWLTTSGKLLGW